MDPQSILRLYDLEMRENAPAGRATIYKQPGLTYFTMPPPSPVAGWVIYTRLEPDAADRAIEATIGFFKQYGEFEWKTYEHDTPHDLKERLAAHGFVTEELEAVLAIDLETVSPGFWETPSTSVRQITDPEGLSDVTRIEAEVWGEPYSELEEMLRTEMQETPDQISVYIAYAGILGAGSEPASSAWIRFYPERSFAELYGGATIPSQRGKGFYTALIKARAWEARRRGVRFLVVDTSPMSRPVLEKLGFVFLINSQPFVMKASEGRI